MSEPLPPGATRLFIPMISVGHLGALTEVLSGGRGAQWFEEFVEILTIEFGKVGLSAADARKAALLLQPAKHPDTLHHTPSLYEDLAQAYSKGEAGGDYFPLLTASSNPYAADAISRSLDRLLGSTRPRARSASIDVNSEELWAASGSLASARHTGPDVPLTRGGVTQVFRHKYMADPVSYTHLTLPTKA